jgi:hypothetical protein
MPKLGYGIFAGGVPGLRISFDNNTNLVTEPATSVGKFKFDSLNGTKLSYVFEIYTQAYDSRYTTGGYLGGFWYFNNHDLNTPSTNNGLASSCGAIMYWRNSGTGSQDLYLFSNWWGFGYLPILEWRQIDPALAANTYNGATVNYSQFSVGNGYVESYNGYGGSSATLINANLYSGSREGYDIVLRSSIPSAYNWNWLLTVFQLPARDDAMPDFSATPVSGQQVLRLSATTARLALPGRTVADINPNNFVFHEDKIPAKIMAAGDINVAASGTATIICPLPLTSKTYMDFMIRRQTDAEFWSPPYFDSISSDKSLAFTYEVQSDRVVITNLKATAVTIRYIIFANSEEAPTSGGKKIFYKGNDGTRDFVQIKRPGSSDLSPNLSDIMVDTRLAYLPVLAQGFLSWTADFPTVISGGDRFKGERMATVSANNSSPALKLFVKQIVVFKSNCYPYTTRNGYHRVFTNSGGTWSGRCSQESSWANIRADESAVDFYMAGANPRFIDGAGIYYMKEWPSTNDSVALGLRYYIFGIPQSL